MSASEPGSGSAATASDGPDAGATPFTGAPRWVKVFALIALVLLVLFLVVQLVGGDHGPGRHTGFGAALAAAARSASPW